MELETKLEEEAISLIEKMANLPANSDDYKKLANRLRTVQQTLAEETKRNNSLQALNDEKRKLAIEEDKVELERQQMENAKESEEMKKRQSKWDRIWEIGKVILGGIVAVGANAGVILLGIRANNSGEVLPSMVTKMIQTKKF